MASIRGTRLLGLSRLNERASPSWSRIKDSVRETTSRRVLPDSANVVQTIDEVVGSYSHSPMIVPRSKIALLFRSDRLPNSHAPLLPYTFTFGRFRAQ